MQNNQWKTIGGQLPKKSPMELRGSILDCTWLTELTKAETFLNPEPYPESGRLDYGGEVARNPAIFHYRGGRPLQQIWGKK